jgi:hypothetical protein
LIGIKCKVVAKSPQIVHLLEFVREHDRFADSISKNGQPYARCDADRDLGHSVLRVVKKNQKHHAAIGIHLRFKYKVDALTSPSMTSAPKQS